MLLESNLRLQFMPAWRGAPVDWLADYEDVFDYGKERMICSELVAWAYHDAQIHIRVQPWPDLYSDGVWTTVERQMDYTTPNMLARSPDLALARKARKFKAVFHDEMIEWRRTSPLQRRSKSGDYDRYE